MGANLLATAIRHTAGDANTRFAEMGFFPGGLALRKVGHAVSRSPIRVASMRANAVAFAAGLALVAVGAPLPATAQYFPPVMIIVPPATHDYGAPKAASKPPPDKPKSAADTDSTSPAKPAGHYQGQTFVPD
jgi:hypothetical protein